ncbi:hypothetical protein FOCC_FOCC016997 [Frankliniella occidentalis]|nr:hypothetical protein FOCC_FOCC016997 [Frankliniella occidentalis]
MYLSLPVFVCRRPGRGAAYSAEEEPKSCCGVLVGQPVSIRWFILLILLVGLCCAVVGTVLGAMKASGREHLTVSLLMIGVGIVLVTVSGVAWRLTSHDAPSCRVMLGMASGDEGAAEPNRRFVPRLPPSYGRPHHPYAAMMYPEFQYRPPPPSYQASMQEYRLRLLLLDRHPGAGGVGGPAPPSSAVSPPPTYRSHAGSLLRAPLGCRREVAASEYSRPPSYRSRSSSTRPSLEPGGGGSGGLAGSLAGALAGALGAAGLHSRTGSVATEHSLSDAGTCPPQPVSVISVGGGDSVKCDPDSVQEVFAITGGDPASSTLQMMLRKSDRGSPTKDTNLVTIVQTSSSGAVTAPAAHPRTAQERPAPVIVTVSGATTTSLPVCSDNTEMEILAHL